MASLREVMEVIHANPSQSADLCICEYFFARLYVTHGSVPLFHLLLRRSKLLLSFMLRSSEPIHRNLLCGGTGVASSTSSVRDSLFPPETPAFVREHPATPPASLPFRA